MKRSLSARRAWIEIGAYHPHFHVVLVALRKESVDRNLGTMQIIVVVVQSLSARRAWIEMLAPRLADMSNASLSARRAWIEIETL